MRRPVARAFAIVCCAAPMAAATLAAQGAERDQQCVAELLKEVEGMTAEEAAQEPCFQLANALESRVSAPATLQMMLARTPPRDFQSRAMGNAGTAGAPSQVEAVPSVQPLALAGGSLAAVGSEGGTDAIAAFTINPVILFGARDDAHAAELTRLLDLTVLAPVNDLDRDEDGKIDYWGLRARINVTGPGAGKHLRQAVTAFAQRVQRSAIVAASLDTVLRETPNFEKCVAAFRADSVFPEAVTAGCGRRLEIAPDPAPSSVSARRWRRRAIPPMHTTWASTSGSTRATPRSARPPRRLARHSLPASPTAARSSRLNWGSRPSDFGRGSVCSTSRWTT
jgi:hypothetical protein